MKPTTLRVFWFVLLVSVTAAQESKPEADHPDTWTLRGRAIDTEGKPIAGADVVIADQHELTTELALTHALARSDADGRFELAWSTPADGIQNTRMMIAASGHASAMLMSYSYGWSMATKVIDLGDVVLPPAIRISGKVRRADGAPLAGARIVTSDPLPDAFVRGRSSDFVFTCIATSGEDGAFVLPTVARPGAALAITAPGYYRVDIPFATPRDPVVVDMKNGGMVRGRVIASDRKTVRAYVSIEYEVSSGPDDFEATAADGAFSLNLDHPEGYRVVAFTRGATWKSALLRAPADDLVVRPPASGDGPAVIVRAIDADSGATLDHVRAGAVWIDPQFLEAMRDSLFRGGLEHEGTGEVRLPGPSEDESSTGVVLVAADGHAPMTLEDVAWDPEHPPVLEAKLAREAVVTGVIVDAATGKPVQDAVALANGKLSLGASGDPQQRPGFVSDAQGRFRLDGLAEGETTITAHLPFRPSAEPVKVKLTAGEQHDGVELSVPTGAKLQGKLVGAQPGIGWCVRLARQEKERRGGDLSLFGEEDPVGRVAADGSFTIAGLAKGSYQLSLLIPQRHLRSGALEIEVESVRIRNADVQREFDVSEELPGAVTGRVRLTGAPFSPDRLAVQAETGPDALMGYARHGATAFVGVDGSYQLDVVAGEHTLRVIDLATGIVLLEAPEKQTVKSAQTVKQDLDVELATVHVRLIPDDEAQGFAASRLEVDVQHPAEGPMVQWNGPAPDSGAGVSLADGSRDVTLYLPPIPTKLRVHTNASNLQEEGRVMTFSGGNAPLVEREITPSLGETTEVEIEIKPPAEAKGEEK